MLKIVTTMVITSIAIKLRKYVASLNCILPDASGMPSAIGRCCNAGLLTKIFPLQLLLYMELNLMILIVNANPGAKASRILYLLETI